MNTVDITVICSVKNGENTISDTIESIISQTKTNWEFIIVDDGSTDNTVKVINYYVNKDPRIKLLDFGNIGRGHALNMAVKTGMGKYIANIDADDPSHPQRLEIQYELMEKNSNFSVLSTNYLLISDKEKPLWSPIVSRKAKVKDITDKVFIRNPVIHSSVMVRREILIDVGLYSESRKSLYDYELWLRIVGGSYKIGYIDEKLSSKRFHENQSYENKNRINYLKDIFFLQKNAIKNSKTKKIKYLGIYLKLLYGLIPQRIRKIVLSSVK